MQSSSWARFKESTGYCVTRLGLFEENNLTGFTNAFQFGSSKSEILSCPEGPVLDWQNPEKARVALRLLSQYVRDEMLDVLGLRIQPELDSPSPGWLRNWARGPVDLTPDHTLYVYLQDSLEEIQTRMKPKARYNLRVSAKHGVEVVSAKIVEAVFDFYTLFQETAARNGFYAEPIGFFLDLAATHFPNGSAEILFATYKGEPIAAIWVIYFGRRATYLYGGSSSLNRPMMPNFALHWQVILNAKTRGCKEYDLYGYDPFGRTDHLYAGITRFKTQWGGTRQSRMGARDYIFYDRLAAAVVEKLTTV
ncbi:MAG TPA: peptidoglycan bridge formation glycyltransferase FemA/FemB family protein [Fimbriimonadaceae bacterium]|jgi:lipid II:glycine glycyltransferase (peptidoglycan interpeptide bridge formation enzyme)